MATILAAMSGGVDSAVAATLLLEQGHTVLGATMLLRDGGEQEAADAEAACVRLGIPFHLFDWRADFAREVIIPFQQVYQQGGTPNPCIFCNRALKFGKFLAQARALGCDGMATGHYARIEHTGGRYLLKKGLDPHKDQAYMLYGLSQQQLAQVYLPLGGLTKPEVRQIAEAHGLTLAHKKDSQDICFIPDGDYMAFLLAHGLIPTPGHFRGPDGADLGPHRGAERYTVGQRRGLDIPYGARIYVLGRDGSDVLLGPEAALYAKTVYLTETNFIPTRPDAPFRATAVLRYSKRDAPCTVTPTATGAILEFDTPQRAPTCGQSAVIYRGDVVLGGGVICGAKKENEHE